MKRVLSRPWRDDRSLPAVVGVVRHAEECPSKRFAKRLQISLRENRQQPVQRGQIRLPNDGRITRRQFGVIHFRGKTLFPARVNGMRPCPANVAPDNAISLPEASDRPDDLFEGEPATFPVRDRVLRAQAIKVNRHVHFRSVELLGKTLEFLPPIQPHNCAAPGALLEAAIVRPGMHFQPAGPATR